MDLILASTSPYRKALVERLGVPFRCLDPGVDEGALKTRLTGATPQALAESLALAKAIAVIERFPEAVVIGGDQVVALGDQILGKPGSVAGAVAQLEALAGRSHELITAMVVIGGKRMIQRTEVATLHFRKLSRAAIKRYVAADRPTDCAGSYKLEARGIALFERIEAADHSAITGLPLIGLTSILLDFGFAIP